MKKKKIKLFKKGSVISKIILYYSAVLLILCTINIVFCFIVKDTLFDKEISKGEEYLRYLSEIMDQKLTEVHNLSYSFLTNKDNMERMANVSSIENQYRLITELNHIVASVGVADHIFLYNSDINTVCSDDGAYSADGYMCNIYGWSGEANAKLNETLKTDKGFFIMPVAYFTGENGADSPFSMIIATSVIAFDNAFRLVIPINDESYAKIAVNDINNVGIVCIINDNDEILFSSQKEYDITKALDAIRVDGSKRSSATDGDNIVLWDTSNYFRGNYIKLIPESIVNKSVRGISVCLFTECAVLILFGIIVAPYFLRLSYMPIYNILWYYKNLFGDESEVKNEYTYIVDGLGRLKTELNEHNEKMLLFNFLQNGYYCEELRELFDREFFVVAIVKIRDKKLLDVITQYIKRSDENVKLIGMNEFKYAAIINDDISDEDVYYRWFDAMLRFVEEQTGERLLVAMSDVLPGSEKINLLYRRAEVAYNQGSCADVGKVFVYTDADSEKHRRLYFPDDTEENIIYAVNNGSREDVKKMISEVFNKNRNIDYSMLEVLNMRFLNLYFKLNPTGSGENFFGMMTAFFDREYELDRIRTRFVEIFLSRVKENRLTEEPAAKVQDFLIDFINENYNLTSLNIDMIAEQLGLSVPYTSRIFKQATGLTFKEYLLNKRIDEAKHLLTTTKLSIKEVSEMVGAGTYNSFVRVFKNKAGISPGRYRAMNKQFKVK